MSMLYTRRVHPREYYEAPLIYSKEEREYYHEATMYNCSVGGMYFETSESLYPQLSLYIKMINFSPDSYSPGLYKVFMANVVWCRKIADTPVYGVGVRHLVRGHIIKHENTHGAGDSCDLCGKRNFKEIHKTEDALYFCRNCFKHMGGMTQGKTNENMLKFMVGNLG
ncbi:PilZ domain-containing protein [Desulfonema magnum]|uniref:PilZ domain-containing protein n=1 Tax=Desulfonema magnum TaxID=45655 RepID=A0A975GQ38_9BACT|nr:PilZ domain-containing protein [Desulfonema magnum]QTA89487.1 PilZ domain-containing protein [Desulfonema magnum]